MKSTGKIHPSPSPPPPDALSVLNLLPAAILALAAVLGADDKEVLAYLVTRSLNGPCLPAVEKRRRSGQKQQQQSVGSAGDHREGFGCGCFDCYTRFWCRWDASPDRELIHQVIERFEEHLFRSEMCVGKSGVRRRRRKKNGESLKEKEKVEEKEVVSGDGKEEVAAAGVVSWSGRGRRKMMLDVMGLFCSRLWSLVCPGM